MRQAWDGLHLHVGYRAVPSLVRCCETLEQEREDTLQRLLRILRDCGLACSLGRGERKSHSLALRRTGGIVSVVRTVAVQATARIIVRLDPGWSLAYCAHDFTVKSAVVHSPQTRDCLMDVRPGACATKVTFE